MNKLFTILAFTIASLGALGQSSNDSIRLSLAEKISAMDSLMTDQYQEKIYIQTDRSVYNPMDTIWYKAWVLQAGTLMPTDKSHLLYIDLVDGDNRVTQSAQYTINAGTAHGQFILPRAQDNVGLYRIHAYTRWQKNFGDSAYFEKLLPIWIDNSGKEEEMANKNFVRVKNKNGNEVMLSQRAYQKRLKKEKEEEEEIKRKLLSGVDLQFLPEGGKLVAGVVNRVAFKAITAGGMSVPVSGKIMDGDGNQVGQFETEYRGMGTFFLTPQASQQYKAVLFDGREIDLPFVEEHGVNLLVQSKATSDTLQLSVNVTQEVATLRPEFYLLVQSRGLLKQAFRIVANRPRNIVIIPKDSLFTGINRLTLFSAETHEPICERLVYVNCNDKIEFDTQAYWSQQSDTVQTMKVKIRPHINGAPVQAVLAVSVSNNNIVPIDSMQKNLRSEMLLASELTGNIEQAGYYFNRPYNEVASHLDLLMLTHGWRGYNWSSDLVRTFKYKPDQEFFITGKVTNLVGNGVEGRRLSLFLQGGRTIADETYTDINGSFEFRNLDVRENSMARVKVEKQTKDRGSRSVFGMGISFDTLATKPKFPIISLDSLIYDQRQTDSLLFAYKQRVEDDKAELDSLKKKFGVYLLDEVVVTGKRKIEGSFNKNNGETDLTISEDQIAKYDAFTNVIEIMKAEIPGFGKDAKSIRGQNGIRVERFFDMYKINGKPIYFQVDAEFITTQDGFSAASNDAVTTAGGASADETAVGVKNAEDDEYNKANLVEDVLLSIAGTEVKAIEVLTSSILLSNYNSKDQTMGGTQGYVPVLDSDFRPIACVVVITTKAGKGPRTKLDRATYFLKMEGGSTPRKFYEPKYYPKDIFSRSEFDKRPQYYWNPEVLTDGTRDIELEFTVGPLMKEKLSIEIEGTDFKGHLGSDRKQLIPEFKKF